MNLQDLTIALTGNLMKQTALRQKYEQETKALIDEQASLTVKRQLIINDVSLDHVSIAESILDIQGNPSNVCEGQQLTKLAADDIAFGVRHLRKQFFGNKQYSSYYQRCDCQYGFGPSHGSIIERVGLKSAYRDKELSPCEVESCIYYLLNFAKIYKSKKETV